LLIYENIYLDLDKFFSVTIEKIFINNILPNLFYIQFTFGFAKSSFRCNYWYTKRTNTEKT